MMKPVALVERAIRNSSKSRDIVLDPFGGSGLDADCLREERPPERVVHSLSVMLASVSVVLCERVVLSCVPSLPPCDQVLPAEMPMPSLSER